MTLLDRPRLADPVFRNQSLPGTVLRAEDSCSTGTASMCVISRIVEARVNLVALKGSERAVPNSSR